jgi:hypothetical protein
VADAQHETEAVCWACSPRLIRDVLTVPPYLEAHPTSPSQFGVQWRLTGALTCVLFRVPCTSVHRRTIAFFPLGRPP